MKRLMCQCFANGFPLVQKLKCDGRKERFGKTAVDILHRLIRRMKHILTIETIVTQFVVEEFVARKMSDGVGNLLRKLVGSQQARSCTSA